LLENKVLRSIFLSNQNIQPTKMHHPQEFTMDSYVASDVDANAAHTTIIFTLKEEPGALAETLKVFKVEKSG
jgi:prephenate dehydratase